MLRDLAELTHWISVIKITRDAAEDPTVSPDERTRGQVLADELPMRSMTRMWQMLLKALEEVALAPNTMMAAEMAIIRLTHVADLPSPEELIRKLQDTPLPPAPNPGGGRPASRDAGAPAAGGGASAVASAPVASGSGSNGTATALVQEADMALSRFVSFDTVVELIRHNRDVKLLIEVETYLRLARYAPGRIEFVPTNNAPGDLATRLAQRLQLWTGVRWGVTIVNEGGGKTIAEEHDAEEAAQKAEAREHPLVQAVFEAFPNSRITEIRTLEEMTTEAAVEALPEVDDEWDPFEED